MNDITEEPAYHKNVLELLTIANEYCLFLEKAEEFGKDEILEFISKISPLLYIKGSLLPVVTVEDDSANERFVTEEEWENVFNALRTKLIPDDQFWYINELTFIDDEITKGSISENLTDTYQDLKDFVMLYQKNSRYAKQNAVKSVYDLFKTNWGPKLLQALKPIHYYLHQKKIPGANNGL